MNLLDKAGAVYDALMAATEDNKNEAGAVLQVVATMLQYEAQAEAQREQQKLYDQQMRMVQPPPGRL